MTINISKVTEWVKQNENKEKYLRLFDESIAMTYI